MITIEKKDRVSPDISAALLENAAKQAMAHQSAPADADLTIVLTDDAQLQQLNHDYLDVDAPTDVLSFPS